MHSTANRRRHDVKAACAYSGDCSSSRSRCWRGCDTSRLSNQIIYASRCPTSPCKYFGSQVWADIAPARGTTAWQIREATVSHGRRRYSSGGSVAKWYLKLFENRSKKQDHGCKVSSTLKTSEMDDERCGKRVTKCTLNGSESQAFRMEGVAKIEVGRTRKTAEYIGIVTEKNECLYSMFFEKKAQF